MINLFRKFILNEVTVVSDNKEIIFDNGERLSKNIFYDFLNAKSYFKTVIPLCSSQGIKNDSKYYLYDICCKYGHLPVRTTKGGKCYKCEESKPKKHNSKIHYYSLTAKEVRKACNQMIIDYPNMFISYETAIKYGFTIYSVYKPCIHGHKPFRHVSTNRCVACFVSRHMPTPLRLKLPGNYSPTTL